MGGYYWAAYVLIGHLAELVPDGVGEDLWLGAVLRFVVIGESRDDAAVLNWLDTHLPRCMALIHRDRRERFLRGVYRKIDEDGRGILSCPFQPQPSPRGRHPDGKL